MNIDETVEQDWLQWMQQEHIPEMLDTGKFMEAKMCQVMVEEEMGGITYSVQYTTDSKETLDRYYTEDAEFLRQKAIRLFSDKFVAFRTELKVVNHTKNFIKS